MTSKRNMIQARQNEEQMLKVQFAARGNYNTAEMYWSLAWLFCFFSAATVFLPTSSRWVIQIGIPIVCDIIAFVFSILQNASIKKAAEFREYFDAYVFGIDADYTQHDRETIISDAKEYCFNHSKKCKVCISNTGDDTPPGVKNWYDLTKEWPDEEVVIRCQMENAWWDKKLMKRRGVLVVAVVVIFLIMWMIGLNRGLDLLSAIRFLCSSALIVKAIERAIEGTRYLFASMKIDGAIEVVGNKPDNAQIQRLQKLINEKRACNVVGINLLHRVQAKKLSAVYRKRNQL